MNANASPKRPRTDSLNRRRRDRRQSTGKRISPQARDLLWFQKLQEHGPLSSSYLHAFSSHLRRSEKRAKDRLTDLFHEDQTPHNGAYLDRPIQQFRSFNARYQDLVFDLAPPAITALKDYGLWREHGASGAGPWRHRFMVSCITASVELATLERSDISYISQSAILDRADTQLRFPVTIKNPKTKKPETKDLIPDAIFGLEYKSAGEKSYRFFIVEADRATEPTRTSNFNRKSHLRTLLQYREYVGQGLYKSHLNLSAGLMVLNVTINPATMNRMLKLTQELSGKGNTYLLFKTIEQFGPSFMTPQPIPEFLTGPWQRAGYGGFRIGKS